MNKQIIIKQTQKQIFSIVNQSEKLDIKTEAQMEMAVDYLKQIKDIGKSIKTQKEKLTNPAQEILRRIRALFKPLEDSQREAESIIKNKMLIYNQVVETRAEKKITRIEDKVKSGKMDIVKAAERIEKVEPKKNYEGAEGKIQYRTIKKILITDRNKIPRIYLEINETLIRQDLLRGVSIPGAKIVEEKQVASY